MNYVEGAFTVFTDTFFLNSKNNFLWGQEVVEIEKLYEYENIIKTGHVAP